jgi:hypothetical protein
MLTEANQDETLARRDKAVAATDRKNSFWSTRRDQQIPPPTRHTHYGVPHFDRGGKPRGRRGGGDPRGGRGRGNPNPRRYELSRPFINVTSSIDIKVGARLSSFADHWLAVTDDPWVLDTVAEGLRINFISEPLQRSSPCDVSMSEEMQAVCKTEVESLLKKGQLRKSRMDRPVLSVLSFVYQKRREGLGQSSILNRSTNLLFMSTLRWKI